MEIYYDGQPVGSIYLNGQFTSALMNAHALYLTGLFSMNVHGGVDMDGVEIRSSGDLIGDAMQIENSGVPEFMALTEEPEIRQVVDENDSRTWKCMDCGCGYSESGGWYKCCHDHTPQYPSSHVVCTKCAYEKHQDWNH